MALKAIISALSEVDEALHPLYKQVGDEFVLDVDDGAYTTRINEFRENNIALSQTAAGAKKDAAEVARLREQAKMFEGIDPAKAREAMEALTKVQEKQLIDAGQIDELLAQRTERMRSDYEGKITALTESSTGLRSDADKMRALLSSEVIDNRLQAAIAGTAPVRKGAMRDALGRGRDVWKLDDTGQPTPIGTDGNVLYGKDGASPITMDEWAQGLLKETPYLFEPSAGGGGAGSSGTDAGDRIVNNDVDSMRGVSLEDVASGKVRVSMG